MMNEAMNVLLGRRSIRSYRPEQVARKDLELLVQVGRYTATAKNNQGCRFIGTHNFI